MHAPEDLPAAHSMDTTWFAIDDHGHIGCFDSGEGGGLPVAHFELWHEQSDWTTLLDELCFCMAPGTLRFVDEGVFEEQPRNSWDRVLVIDDPSGLDKRRSYGDHVLLELAEAPALPDLDVHFGATGSTLLAPSSGRSPLVYLADCSHRTLAKAWHALGIVRARLGYSPTAERVGVFGYDNDSYDGHPYRRSGRPVGPPLRVEELPVVIRRRLGQVHLELSDFRRDEQIQPFESLASTIWGTQWIDTLGEVHAIE